METFSEWVGIFKNSVFGLVEPHNGGALTAKVASSMEVLKGAFKISAQEFEREGDISGWEGTARGLMEGAENLNSIAQVLSAAGDFSWSESARTIKRAAAEMAAVMQAMLAKEEFDASKAAACEGLVAALVTGRAPENALPRPSKRPGA